MDHLNSLFAFSNLTWKEKMDPSDMYGSSCQGCMCVFHKIWCIRVILLRP